MVVATFISVHKCISNKFLIVFAWRIDTNTSRQSFAASAFLKNLQASHKVHGQVLSTFRTISAFLEMGDFPVC